MATEDWIVRTEAGSKHVPAFDFAQPWKERAACVGRWDLFDLVDIALNPVGGISEQRQAELDAVIGAAVALCDSCPVRQECHEAVVPPQTPTYQLAYSIVAGKQHAAYHPDFQATQARRKKQRATRVTCPHCRRRYSPQTIAQHISGHVSEIRHGTCNGYYKHRARDEEACAECTEAMRVKSHDMRARRRAHKKAMREAVSV